LGVAIQAGDEAKGLKEHDVQLQKEIQCPRCKKKRTSIDRPEIAYIRKVIPINEKMQFRYLYFLVENATEDAKPSPLTIPKSFLFFECKETMRKCVDTIRSWLIWNYGYSWERAVKTVIAYHETVSKNEKTRMYAEFRKEDSRIRIVCGTDAISTDLDVPDVSRVIQVGMVKDGNVDILLQRLGRGGGRANRRWGSSSLRLGGLRRYQMLKVRPQNLR
jgi:superfamily II DNA/RNA helicase